MQYNIRLGKYFFITTCWTFVAAINLWRYCYNVSNAEIYHTLSTLIIYSLLMGFFLPPFLKQLYLFFLRPPVFIANESYVFDCYEGIKYYWVDIEYIEYTKDEQLEIKLKKPAQI
jgi:hypothetical protein